MKIPQGLIDKYPNLKENIDFFNVTDNDDLCWEHSLSDNLTVVAAQPDLLVWEFEVEKKHCNRIGGLHGGCVASLIDVCSSFAILIGTGKTWKIVGISTDLSVSYVRGVKAGEKIRIECEVQKVGATLANIYTKIYNSKNQLCYSGSHTKFCIDPKL